MERNNCTDISDRENDKLSGKWDLNPESGQLLDATISSLQQGVLTPLIKQELKYTILNKRLRAGKPELQINFPEPKVHPLTEEEEMKIERRRDQNRKAADRFRKRHRKTREALEKRISDLKVTRLQLELEYKTLVQEKYKLLHTLHEHSMLCNKMLCNELEK